MFLSVLLFMFGGAAVAAPLEVDFTCATSPPTTSFGVWSEGDKLMVRVVHYHGARFAPSIVGIYTPNDLPYLARQAKLVEKMPDITTFRWPLKNCSRKGGVLKCFGTDDVQEGKGGAKLQPFAFHTGKLREETIAGLNEYTQLSLGFDVDGESGPRVQMKFPSEDCTKGTKL